MVRVTIDSIQVSLVSPQRIIVLREEDGDRHLPIWVGPNEAEALHMSLRNLAIPRPLTHDLLKSVIEALHASVRRVVVTRFEKDVYYAVIELDQRGRTLEIDARPSDAINLAARVSAPIFVEEAVLDAVALLPEADLEATMTSGREGSAEDENLSVFADFLESLDLDDLSDD